MKLQLTTLGVNEKLTEVPREFALLQNYPNPFNSGTRLGFRVAERTTVTIDVYDILGRRVASLGQGVTSPGEYSIPWDASGMASGVYFIRMEAGKFTAVRKAMLLR